MYNHFEFKKVFQKIEKLRKRNARFVVSWLQPTPSPSICRRMWTYPSSPNRYTLNLFSGRNIPDKNCTLRSISRDFPPPLTVISLSQAAETVTCTKADCRYNFCFQRKWVFFVSRTKLYCTGIFSPLRGGVSVQYTVQYTGMPDLYPGLNNRLSGAT